MCCAPYDDAYPYLGGAWIRTNPSSGRVGSAFAEAGQPADYLEDRSQPPEPTPAIPPPRQSAPPQGAPAPIRRIAPRHLGETYLRQIP